MTKVDPNFSITRKDLDDAVETILIGVDGMFKSPDNPMNKRLDSLESKVDNLETKVDNLETKVGNLETTVDNHYHWLKNDIDDLKADFSNQVSRKEFNQLKKKVDILTVS
jgi:hypothetical protein